MIELKMNKGSCNISMNGHRIQLLAEIPIGFGRIIKEVLDGAPDDLIKTTFELTLREIMEKEDDEE